MKKNKKKIYLDYASAAPLEPSVFRVMSNIEKKFFANPSGIHKESIEARNIIEGSRKKIAGFLNAHSDEIIFTGSGTESNNLAIQGIINQVNKVNQDQGSKKMIPHIITTNIEHPSVLEVCQYLERTGQAEVTLVAVEPNGIVDPKKIKEALKLNTILVSVMYANNEIGVVQPITEIAKVIRNFRKLKAKIRSTRQRQNPKYINSKRFGFRIADFEFYENRTLPYFHIDACQAMNYLPVNVEKLGADLLSFNGSKIYGPKGIGVLFKKRNVHLMPIMHGGGQEFGLRPGTENTAVISGLARALEITEKIKENESERLIKLRNYFVKQLLKLSSNQSFEAKFQLKLNGDLEKRLPNNINISIEGFSSELLVIEFDARGIAVSAKSACQAKEQEISYVIKAIRPDSNLDDGSIRFSLGRKTTMPDIDYTLKAFREILLKYKDYML